MREAAALMERWLHMGGIYHVMKYVEGDERQVLHCQRGGFRYGKENATVTPGIRVELWYSSELLAFNREVQARA